MARVITFSRNFPSHHPRKGDPTLFIEKLWAHFYPDGVPRELFNQVLKMIPEIGFTDKNQTPKIHTIRKGNRWKKGDLASLRVWSGKPYQSKQLKILLADVPVIKTYAFRKKGGSFYISGKKISLIGSTVGRGTWVQTDLIEIAQNDGLKIHDFLDWFRLSDFSGQIICFSDIKYK